nr:MAG TPA: hypothetical protein [Caudoviricetes sp.]
MFHPFLIKRTKSARLQAVSGARGYIPPPVPINSI